MTIDLQRLRGRFAQRTKVVVLTIPSLRLVAVPSIVSTLRALQWGLIGLTVLSVGLIGWWWQETQEIDAIAERYETAALRTETLNRQFETQLAREGLTLPGDQIALVQGKIAFANLLSEKRAFSWTRLLSELEETVPANVSIGSVKLDFQQSSIVVDGLARSLQDVNVFVQTLQTHRAFQKAVLAKHEVHKGRDGGAVMPIEGGADAPHHDIEFTLAVDYRAAIMNGSMGE
jgi:Fimbrial assembly protein (PilN)